MAPVLTVENLHTHFISKSSVVRAVNGVNFALEGESVLVLVGERVDQVLVVAGCVGSYLERYPIPDVASRALDAL